MPGDGGPELGWGAQLVYQEEMRAGTLVLRAECAAGSEAGGQQRKEVCLQPPKAVRKQGPFSRDLLPGPLVPLRGGSGPE